MSSSPGPPGPLQRWTVSPRARRVRIRWVPTNPSAPVTRTFTSPTPAESLEVSIHHHLHQLAEADRRLPAELGLGLGRVADQEIHLCRPYEPRVRDDVLLPVEPDVREGDLAELAHAVRLVRGDHVVVRR